MDYGKRLGTVILLFLLSSFGVDRCSGREENLALNKPTEQSSTGWEGYSRKAVDGNADPNYYRSMSCTHTLGSTIAWWLVDLQKEYSLSHVRITNRVESPWLYNFTIEMSSEYPSTLPGFPGHTTGSSLCVNVPTPVSLANVGGKDYYCERPLWARYIRVLKLTATPEQDGFIVMCEFEAYASGNKWKFTAVQARIGQANVLIFVPKTESNIACGLECIRHNSCLYFYLDIDTATCKLMSTDTAGEAQVLYAMSLHVL